jgi:hypothetical protein
MGIVVSGEDGNLGISKEKQRLNLLAAENDCGLAVATIDQVLMFVSSWWTTSLRSRIQVRDVTTKSVMREKFKRLIMLRHSDF